MSKIWGVIFGASIGNAMLAVMFGFAGSNTAAWICGIHALYFAVFCYFTRDVIRGGQDV